VRARDAAGNSSPLSSALTAKTVAVSGSNATLTGVVYGAAGAPLAGAAVKVTVGTSVKSAKTNGSGVWKIAGIAPGTRAVAVGLAGYATQSFTMTATAGATIVSVAVLGPA
jgi:hypothetical protein